ncbi:galactose metabolism regulatory protein GAL80 [Coleophoma cylindrospora]|uniref:Galactose metabolism regulatory protein GAL80 n=1 Tax=Coleophoma cylindrospora TaxID=1849047 RepID=A0A3D8Q4A7_9HELO|nr:galactose metabolism regulatory protein GAL80 [Coleophoma cylindrospora]
MPIKLGIIGLSTQANSWTAAAHIVPLRSHPSLSAEYTLTALVTSTQTTAIAAADKWGLPSEKAYSSAAEITADPDVNLVVVGVKVPLHKELALPALKAGKDVFVEWPLANGSEEAQELVIAAREGGGRTLVGLQARCSPAILKAKEILDSGALGRIISTDILGVDSRMIFFPPAYDYSRDAKNGANITTIIAGHVLDAMCFLLGEFAFLTANAKVNFPEVTTPFHDGPVSVTAFDSLSIHGELESGTTATFQIFSTTSGMNSFTWIITGEKGSLKFEADGVAIQMDPPKLFWYQQEASKSSAEIYTELDGGPRETWEPVEVADPMAYGQVGEVYHAFAIGEKVKGCLVDFEGAALRHRMLDACFKSARDGTRETYRK